MIRARIDGVPHGCGQTRRFKVGTELFVSLEIFLDFIKILLLHLKIGNFETPFE